MADISLLSVLVDTSYLITLYDDGRPNHKTAKTYFKYLLENKIKIYLSTIVISEFQQGQSVVDLINNGKYIVLPFNYEDAIKSAELAFNLGGQNRSQGGETAAKQKDDIKIMGQAEQKKIDFILTEDESTLTRYAGRLSGAGIFSPKIIKMSDKFDSSWFNNGQASLLTNN